MYHHVKIVREVRGETSFGTEMRPDPGSLQLNVGWIWDKNEKQGKKNAFSPKPLQSLAQAGRTHRNPVNTFCIKSKTLALQEWLYPSHGKPTKQRETKQASLSWCLFLNDASRSSLNPGEMTWIMGPWSMWQNIWYQANPRQITAVTADVPSN